MSSDIRKFVTHISNYNITVPQFELTKIRIAGIVDTRSREALRRGRQLRKLSASRNQHLENVAGSVAYHVLLTIKKVRLGALLVHNRRTAYYEKPAITQADSQLCQNIRNLRESAHSLRGA